MNQRECSRVDASKAFDTVGITKLPLALVEVSGELSDHRMSNWFEIKLEWPPQKKSQMFFCVTIYFKEFYRESKKSVLIFRI